MKHTGWRKLVRQAVKFGGVGLLCFFIDYGLLFLLTEYGGVYYLLSCVISFSVSVVVNYLLSVRFVFDAGEGGKARQFVLFVVFSVIGLGLTAGMMKLGVEGLSLGYRPVKIIATGIVMVYNFVTRKLFLER